MTTRSPLGIEKDQGNGYPKKFNPREYQLMRSMREDNNIDEAFNAPLVWSSVDQEGHLLGITAPAAGDEVAFKTDKHTFLAHVQSINGTAVQSFPYVSADGLEINTDDDATNGITGWEISNGILATSKAAYTVGSFPDGKSIYFEGVITIDDISDVSEMGFGFRKAEAFQAAVDNYDEMASFNIGQDADGQVEVHTILNNAATAETDTTLADWADTETHTLRIEVTNAGVCKFLYDGTVPTVTAAFTFDAGEVIVPFLFLVCETGDPGVSVSSWEIGIS